MRKRNRIIFAGLIFLPISLFIFPLWSIDMEAPQFPPPDELGLRIYINRIEGSRDNALESINNLNHYIGMKKINPDEVLELKIMPYIIIAMILTGIIAIAVNKKMIFKSWLVVFSLVGIVGLIDFYLWQQDYGSNLDPKAIIKTEGVKYDPPFIGTKKIMNFTVSSYPASGGILLFTSLIGGWVAIFADSNKKNKGEEL